MNDALQNAFATADGLRASFASAKSANVSDSVLAGNTYGFDRGYSKLTQAREQYGHNRGWVYTAIRSIAQTVARQPLCVGRIGRPSQRKLLVPDWLKSMADNVEPIESHPLLLALSDPNPVMVRWSLMSSTVGSLLLTGRSHWWLHDDGDGLQVWPIPAHWLRPSDPLRGSWFMRPDNSTDEVEIGNEDVATFMLPDPATPFGCISPLQSQAAAVSIDESIQRTQFDVFKSGVHPQLAVRVGRHPGSSNAFDDRQRPVLTADQRNEVVAAIMKFHSGSANRNTPLILDGMIEGVDRLSATPQEMDFLHSGEQVKSRLLQAFGVNPIIAGEIENANRASAAVAGQLFCEHTVNPIIELMSQVLTEWIAKRFDPRLLCWIEPARANDPEQRLAEWKAAAALGYVTPNEFRRNVLGIADIDGGDVRTDSLGNPIDVRSTLPTFSRNGHAN